MKANGLMIGDYVSVKPSGMLIKIAAVHHKKVAYHSCVNRLTWVRESLLEPIPLTPEILEKNGFDYACNHWYHKTAIVDTLSVWRCCVNIIFDDSIFIDILNEKKDHTGKFSSHIKYLHELQQAMHLLDIEKEIEL